jgi:Fe2+ transport system protein FeoA
MLVKNRNLNYAIRKKILEAGLIAGVSVHKIAQKVTLFK